MEIREKGLPEGVEAVIEDGVLWAGAGTLTANQMIRANLLFDPEAAVDALSYFITEIRPSMAWFEYVMQQQKRQRQEGAWPSINGGPENPTG